MATEKTTTTCPHCGAKTVEYPHRLTRGLVTKLLRLHRTHGPWTFKVTGNAAASEWRDVNNTLLLQHWGFIERVDPTKRTGNWRVTDRGRDFCLGLLNAQRVAWTYRGKLVRYEGEYIGIGDELPAEEWQHTDYAQRAQPHAVAKV